MDVLYTIASLGLLLDVILALIHLWLQIWTVYGPFFVTVNPDDIVRPILVKLPVENSSLVLLIRCMPIFWIVHLVPWAGPLMAHSGTRYFVIHVSSNRAYSEMDVHSTTASLGFSFHVLLARFLLWIKTWAVCGQFFVTVDPCDTFGQLLVRIPVAN